MVTYHRSVDDIFFKALADPSRRRLLDKLFARDGQTLVALETHLPAMTRFGVMKHLRILEDAGLVTTHRHGREKLHYLNPVPIRRVFDRWTSKYARRFTRALADLKTQLEGDDDMSEPNSPRHVYEVYIRTTPDKLWKAITDPAFTRQYFDDQLVESTWQPGGPLVHRTPDGTIQIEGRVVEIDPPRRLVHTFTCPSSTELAKDRPSRVTWLIEPMGETCRLTLTHDDFDGETATWKSVGRGWNPVLSSLKTLLETGKPLVIRAA